LWWWLLGDVVVAVMVVAAVVIYVSSGGDSGDNARLEQIFGTHNSQPTSLPGFAHVSLVA
jgi:hypothetical protein